MQKLFKQVVVLAITLIAGMGVMIAIFDSSKVSAASYTFEVTIPDNAMLEVKLFNPDGTAMGDATSMNVSPTSLFEAGFNEKDMVVSVGTNNEWGYNLTMNVSNTSLVSQTDSSNTIPSLADKTGGYTCTVETAATCDFTVNSWGFKIKNATTTQAATNYIPVPTSINLNRNSTVTNGDPTYISFGSRVDASQKPGFYTTTINFVATANPDPDPRPAMQNISAPDLASLIPSDGDTTTLKDSRDNNKYQITNINGAYWMTDNLRFTGTNLTPADTNVTQNTTMTYTDLKTLGNSYTSAGIHYDTTDANSSTYGTYYNYCAVSAGTVCSETTQQDATQDICPKGWRLPTQSEVSNFTNTTSDNKNRVLAGNYSSGSLKSASSFGYWWSTGYNGNGTPVVMFAGGGIEWSMNYGDKSYGYSVRCIYDITMQNIPVLTLTNLMPNDGDSTFLKDRRDNNEYRITKISGTYWMTQNLRIMGTISAADSNFTGADFNISAGGDLTAGNTYTEPRAHFNTSDTNSSTYGAYYNYCAASAGTVCSETTKQDATSDICPKGWRLPTYTEIHTIWNNNGTNFNPVLAGYYGGGSLYSAGSYGYWWSATAYNTKNQYYLGYGGSSWNVGYYYKHYGGYSIRCVRS